MWSNPSLIYLNYSLIFSHSIFIALILSSLLYIASEIKRNRYYKISGGGLFLGFIFHILLDLIFWIDPIYIFWPILDKDLSITVAGMLFYGELDSYRSWLLARTFLEFLFLHFYGKSLIEVLIKNRSSAKAIKALSFYKSGQLNLFILFFGLFFVFYSMSVVNLNLLYTIFNTIYFLSLLTVILITHKTRINF